MRLNKYVAHSGIASRRKCAELVKNGLIMVNDAVVMDPSYIVQPRDVVKYQGKVVRAKRNYVYLLMNKPKGFITTTSDERGRRTVMDLIKEPIDRLYPVGRLDRTTTGLLLLTNDGDLAQKLTHPSFDIKKVYEARLNKAISKEHIEQILGGVHLEDGWIKADLAEIKEGGRGDVVKITMHSGRNRIVRRIFEHLGYEVIHLDRVYYAGMTKKNLGRGRYRKLNDAEIRRIKYFNKL